MLFNIMRQSLRMSSLSSKADHKILIAGGLGQLGLGIARVLRTKFGRENVIISDVKDASPKVLDLGPYQKIDITNINDLEAAVVDNKITCFINYAALLSGAAEANFDLTMKVNMLGAFNAFHVASKHKLQLFIPSSIAVFGETSPKIKTPNETIMRPSSIYGVTKVSMELLGEYYHSKFGLDFRCLRLPGIISYDSEPGFGTTDYAVHVFHEVLKNKNYECYLHNDTRLPMMYIDDVERAIYEFLLTPSEKLKKRTYNISGFDFTPQEIFDEISKSIPDMKITYNNDPIRQAIANTWPHSLDDSAAFADWGWKAKFDLTRTCKTMLTNISAIMTS